ncbi:MFS transporter [Microbacterium sp. ZW T2_14]|uniref:MFS transporter n=1 Tax=Microbacterium sp. ZW T2_14 TaxID=3378079 RepID=UPI0038539C9D
MAAPTATATVPTARLPFGKLVAWAGAGLSAAANFIILGYVAIYCTDTLGLSPAIVGVLLLVSNLCNAALALVAAYIVDRSPETRWGKARPYEFAIIGIWATTWLMFSTPSALGETGRIIWVFVTFIMIQAVFRTLLDANDNLYLARAFYGRRVYAKVTTRSGIVTSLGAIAVTVTLPMVLNAAGKSPEGWSTAIAWFAIPLAIIGMSRFVFVKETHLTADAGAPPVKVRDILVALKGNTWIFAIAALQLFASAINGAGAGAYYFRYVVGDLGMQSIVLGAGILILPSIIFLPVIMKRVAISRIIMAGAVAGMIGSTINAFAGASIPMLIVGGLFTGLALLPVSYLAAVLILDLCSYNEWKGNRRLESTIGAIVGIFTKIGAGLAGAFVGLVLTIAGYDGGAETQAPAANSAIVALYSWFPLALFAGVFVVMMVYGRFDRFILPQAQAELEARGEEAHHATEFSPTPPVIVGGSVGVDAHAELELLAAERLDAEADAHVAAADEKKA